MNLVSLRFQMAGCFPPLPPPFSDSATDPYHGAEGRSGSVLPGREGECARRSKDKGPVWFRLGQQAQGRSQWRKS